MEFGTFSLVVFVAGLVSTIISIGIAFVAPIFSHWVKIAEFRQAWINDQRKDVAEYLGLTRQWVIAAGETSNADGGPITQRKEVFDAATSALVVLWRIKMRINPRPNEFAEQDAAFIDALTILLERPLPDPNHASSLDVRWREQADHAIGCAQQVFKTEWEVTKKTIVSTLWRKWRRYRQARDEEITTIQR